MSNADDFLMGGGVTSAKFEVPGTTVGGPILRQPEVQQQRDYSTGEAKFWDDGKPMQQLAVQVQTDQRDPEQPDDDGVRAFYIKGNMLKAVREAVRKAGAKGLETGGHLAITYTGDGEAKKRGFNPPKLYSATYTPPAAASANSVLNSEPTGQPAAAPQAAGQPDFSAMTPEQVRDYMVAQQQGGQPPF